MGVAAGPCADGSNVLLAVGTAWIAPDTTGGVWQRRQERASLCPFLREKKREQRWEFGWGGDRELTFATWRQVF